MKLRTSYSKLTTFKKNIFRFAPIWALYAIVLLLVLLGESGREYDWFARNTLSSWISGYGVVNLILAFVVGQALFGDLYNTRMCYALHSLPQRREAWLLSHLGAGLLFALVPNVLAAGLMILQLEAYWYLGLYVLLALMLQYLFFLGVAAVSALLVGNRFAMLAMYALINFVSMLAYATVQVLYIPSITGVVANYRDFSQLSPVVHLFQMDFFTFRSTSVPDPFAYSGYRDFYVYEGLSTGWGYTVILGVLGLVAMGIALLLYRKRHLESAGDFLAFPKLKGVMCVVLTVCVALGFSLVGSAFSDSYLIWMGVGLIVGFFGSLMLLERRVKVFRKKTLLGFGLMAVVAVLSLVVVANDWLGIESWTPNASRVESVTVSNSGVSYDYYGEYYGDRMQAKLTEEADIAQVIRAHQDILDHLDFRKVNPNAKTHRVTLVYKMKSGRTVTRTYSAPASGVNYEIITAYLYTKESVLGFQNPAAAAGMVDSMILKGVRIPPHLYEQVLTVLLKDFDAGTVSWNNAGKYYLEYTIRQDDGVYLYRSLHFGEEALGLMEMLTMPQLQMGYKDWETFLEQVRDLNVDGMNVTGQAKVTLLEAMRKDVEAGTLMADDYYKEPAFTVEYSCVTETGEYIYRYFAVPKDAENTMTWYTAFLELYDKWNPEGI